MAMRKAVHSGARAFSAQAAKPSLIQRLFFDAPSQNPLNEEFPGVPRAASVPAVAPEVHVSKLANGVTFASIDQHGPTASVGVFVKAGSRYESVAGTSHLLEHIAFSTTQRRSTLKIQRDVEDFGGAISARTGREVFTYSGSALRGQVDGIVGVLGEVLTQPKLWPWEVAEQRAVLGELLASQPADPRTAILEGVHAAAFGSTAPLGRSIFASAHGLEGVDADAVRSFLGGRVDGANIAVVATNVDHAALSDKLNRHFLSVPDAVAERAAGASGSVVVGGESLTRTHEGGGLAHVAVALAAPGLSSAQLPALHVLQALLGGTGRHGGAAGAPRLGPQGHSRIARSVHNEAHSFIASLTAFALPYSDAGLLGLAGSAADHEAGRLVHAIAGFLKDAAALPVSDAELARAKAACRLRLAAAAETRDGARDALGSALLLQGADAGKRSLADALKAVDAVTAAQVADVARAALASKPSISAVGSLATVPRYDVFAALFK